jgi:NAD(P)-dependent dehydrogenase (short-subunit alcohol dehydrogenase family)
LNPEHGTLALKKLADQGITARFFQGDVTSETCVKEVVAGVDEAYGKIDVLVNNAGGLGGRSPIADMGTDFWDKVLNLNLKSTFLFVRECIPLLKRGQSASIINNTSIAAYTGGGPGAAAYATAKAGIIAFTRGLAKELAPLGIRVNAVSPGTIDTDFHNATAKDLLRTWEQSIPMKRLGLPSEVAGVVFFLASEEASYLTGEIIQVNGGQMMM